MIEIQIGGCRPPFQYGKLEHDFRPIGIIAVGVHIGAEQGVRGNGRRVVGDGAERILYKQGSTQATGFE